MKRNLIFILIAFTIIACRSNTQESVNKDTEIGVGINYDTKTGIPEFEEETEDAVMLRYNYKAGDSAKFSMKTIMEIEMMGQKMPVEMTIESKYNIGKITKEGNAEVQSTFSRISMMADGPMPMKFDSDNPAEMENNPTGQAFLKMLNKPVTAIISPLGKVVEMNFDELREILPEESAEKITNEIQGMSNQFTQNAIIPLPGKALKKGDVYDAGTVSQNANMLQIDMKMQYEVLAISANKRYVLLKPDGDMTIGNEINGIEMKTENNKIGGWILFDVHKGFIQKSNMKMNMDITADQMGQMKMNMDILLELK